MSERNIKLKVLRYNPEVDAAPFFQTYEVPCLNEWVVLDALNWVKENLDPGLSYRWSCHMAVCGSCGMMINGEATLSCKAFIRNYPDVIQVEPMAHFPIERDLVTDAEDFMAKFSRIKPYLMPEKELPLEAGPRKQTPAQLAKYKQYTLCINCMLCYAACPEYGLEPEFLGPAALSMAHRYNLDSRDAGQSERLKVTATDKGVWTCSFVGACSEVCPKHVDPGGALQQAKVTGMIDWFAEKCLPRGEK